MTIKTFLISSLALLLLISCKEETESNETTITEKVDTIIKEKAPKLPSIADKIKMADAQIAKIEASKEEQSIEKRRYANVREAHDQSIYMVYSLNDKIVKLTENMGESMYSSDATYYYQDTSIFLIHTLYSFDDNLYKETKVYIEKGQVITAMGRSKEEQDMDTSLASLPIKKLELDKVVYNMDSYLNHLSKIPSRLAASTPE
jgi:hypothetical protein